MVTGLSPAAGLTRGVTSVLVYGSGLAGTVLVRVGATLDSQFTIKSDHELELTIPAGAPGTVDVRAEALVGWSPVRHADRFTYQTTAPPPTTTPATVKGFSPVSATYVSRSEGWVWARSRADEAVLQTPAHYGRRHQLVPGPPTRHWPAVAGRSPAQGALCRQ